MVERGLTEPEARARPEVMDLCPQGGSFLAKFHLNQLLGKVGQPVGEKLCN